MESLLFVGVAVIILIPVLFFLPLGFSSKGKISIIVAALFISLIGIVFSPSLASWQAILIELLLISIVFYFMATKLEDYFIPVLGSEESYPMDDNSETPEESLNEVFSFIATSGKESFDKEYDVKTNLLVKAVKMVGGPDDETIIKSQSERKSESLLEEVYFPTSAELAATSEQSNEVEQLQEHSYLAEMEESLLIEAEEDVSVERKGESQLVEAEVDALNQSTETDWSIEEIDFSGTELPQSDSVIMKEFNSHQTGDLQKDYGDELPELKFVESNNDLKNKEDFWASLLEDDELEVLEDKKKPAEKA